VKQKRRRGHRRDWYMGKVSQRWGGPERAHVKSSLMRTCKAKPPTKRFPIPQAALVKG